MRLPDPPGGATDLQAALDAIATGFEARVDDMTHRERARPASSAGRDGRAAAHASTGPPSATPSTTTMMAGLIDAIDAAGRDEAVRAILLAGAGDHFCSGADIVGPQRRPARATGPGSARSSAGCRRWPTA